MSSAIDVAPPIPTLQLSNAVTETDHGQIVVVVAWLCLTAGILLSLVRVYIRWPLNALAGKDDAAYAVSAIFAVVQTAIAIDAVKKGFGQTESELRQPQVVDAAKVSDRLNPPQESPTTFGCDRWCRRLLRTGTCHRLHIAPTERCSSPCSQRSLISY